MKYLILFLSVTIFSLGACNEPKRSKGTTVLNDTAAVIENKIMIPASSCYSGVNDKDSVYLKVEQFPNVVTGNLSYQFYQKDANKGGYEGKLFGDTLIADYTFMSEGKQSIRQVIFLIRDGIAREGYGNMEEKNGKMVFVNHKDINFGKSLVLKKVPCGEH